MEAIYFDMDGTLADLYKVDNWLSKLRARDATPYIEAKPLLNLNLLARYLNKLQRKGYRLGIISWLAKDSTPEYDKAVTTNKIKWLSKHLTSVQWNEIHIIKYGKPKQTVALNKHGALFDDNEEVRENWTGEAYTEKEIIEILKMMLS